jgi:N-acetylmuramate 1-kinase
MNNLAKPLLAWVNRWVVAERLSTDYLIEPLVGDGSPRTFYRIRWPERSYVLLWDPAWAFSKDYFPHQAYLTQAGIPVPRFLKEDAKEGFLVMEDLGDELLQLRILKDPSQKLPWLTQAAVLLAQLHGSTYPVPASLPASTRSFDQKKYSEELNFTLEHLSEKFLGFAPPSPAEREALNQYCADLASLAPTVFCHRDYHCRNLLVHKEGLFMIDFQDARLGAPHYDLASLLYDAYISISDAERALLVQSYKTALKLFPLFNEIAWESFSDDLEMVAFQRVVKAAGSFASFYTRFGKSTHLPYLIPSLTTALELKKSCPVLPKELDPVLPLAKWKEAVERKGT